MRPAVMELTLAVQERRADAEKYRKDAEYHRQRMDDALANALDCDNRAIDMEDAITKLDACDTLGGNSEVGS